MHTSFPSEVSNHTPGKCTHLILWYGNDQLINEVKLMKYVILANSSVAIISGYYGY